MLYIIWILISAAIFGKVVESEENMWLMVPSMFSIILGMLCALLDVIGII